MTLADYRSEFPTITEADRVPLNNCSAGPIPQRGIDARRECERVWTTHGNPWEAWLERVNEAKARFADLINATPDEIAVLSSATGGLARVADALDYDDRDEVVVSDLEFPTVPQFWRGQESRGATVRVAESPDGVSVPVEAYDAVVGEDTRLVCTSHARSFTGSLLDVRALADVVHDADGLLVLDAYQSAGVVPIDVDEMGVDVLVSGTLKFLLGGPGIAFLYVDERVVEDLEPASVGWFGVDDVFAFRTEDYDLAPGARRFELGTPPAPNAYAAAAGMDLIAEVGVGAIRERVTELTDRLIAGADERGFPVRTPRAAERRGGVVNVQVDAPEETAGAMLDAGFDVTTRAGGVRLAPHFYNTDDEVERALDVLAANGEPRE